jgi:hypothetical protein
MPTRRTPPTDDRAADRRREQTARDFADRQGDAPRARAQIVNRARQVPRLDPRQATAGKRSSRDR